MKPTMLVSGREVGIPSVPLLLVGLSSCSDTPWPRLVYILIRGLAFAVYQKLSNKDQMTFIIIYNSVKNYSYFL